MHGVQSRQDHYNAYVEDFTILEMVDGDKVVQFEENTTKTRRGGFEIKRESFPQQMWCTDGGERDPVRIFEECLTHRPKAMKNSGPLYLAIIPRPPQMFGMPNPEWGNIASVYNEIRCKLLARRMHKENHQPLYQENGRCKVKGSRPTTT